MSAPTPQFGQHTGSLANSSFLDCVRDELQLLAEQKIHADRAGRFLDACAERAQWVAEDDGASLATPDKIRKHLVTIGTAAHQARNALTQLSGDRSPYFLALQDRFDVLRLSPRSDEYSLPENTPDLGMLLQRLWLDLDALRVASAYAAETLPLPGGKPAALRTELLVRLVAEAYHSIQGQWPAGDWFVDFMKVVAEAIGLPCGKDRVAAGISAAKGSTEIQPE